MSKGRIAKEVVLWFLALWLVFVFLRAGVTKFDDASGWSRAFRSWGFPVWFRIFIGAVEAGAALLMLWPRTAFYGAVSMGVVMLGAIATFVVTGGRMHPAPFVAIAVASVVAIFRWRQRLRSPAPPSAAPASMSSNSALA